MTKADPELLHPEDLAILRLESDTVVGHTCKVIVLGDGAPDVAALRESIARRVSEAPQLTRRLGDVEGAPAWVPDEHFDVANHVVDGNVDQPVDATGLRCEVARCFSERLDRARPLWRIDVVPLEDGGRALIWRLHHALADGTAAMRFSAAILWDPQPQAAPTSTDHHPAAAADDARRRGHLMGFIHRELGSTRRSPFDGRIGTRREVAFATVPMAPLHDRAKAACSASINDAVLAIVGGGIRRWLEARHGKLGTIRLRVPVSLHHEGDNAGNRDSFFTIAVPLHETDPLIRLAHVHAATGVRKTDQDAEEMEDAFRKLARVSPGLRGFAERVEASSRSFAVAVSNVVGPRAPVSVDGARVRALYSLAEIGERHGLRVSVVSMADQLQFGWCADPAIVPGVQAMAEGTEAEAEELLHADGGGVRTTTQSALRPSSSGGSCAGRPGWGG